jgi:hypothetical protein
MDERVVRTTGLARIAERRREDHKMVEENMKIGGRVRKERLGDGGIINRRGEFLDLKRDAWLIRQRTERSDDVANKMIGVL